MVCLLVKVMPVCKLSWFYVDSPVKSGDETLPTFATCTGEGLALAWEGGSNCSIGRA